MCTVKYSKQYIAVWAAHRHNEVFQKVGVVEQQHRSEDVSHSDTAVVVVVVVLVTVIVVLEVVLS